MTRPQTSAFFTDIAGLRGVAVLLVVVFHSRVPGFGGGFVGVDVFFVISGFLITGLLIREFERSGTLSFKGFYARRARRIIPAAALVIVVSLIGAALTMPLLRVFKQSVDLLAAAANLANWHFIAQNADYLAGAIDGSLATHFWSLAIEEQLYFVWPLTIFGAAVLIARTPLRNHVSIRWSILLVVGAVTVGSLVWAIRLTPVDPATAYMATYTRAWQFGVGGLLAVAEPLLIGAARRARPTRWLAAALGWAGLAGIVASVVTISASTPYPGTAALLPTVSTALIIASGQVIPADIGARAGNMFTPGFLLSLAPIRFLGRVSYAWYLWHWPALVLFETQTGMTSWPALLAVGGVSLAIATASTLFFEEPIIANTELRRNHSASLSVGLTGLVVGLAVAMTAGVITVKVASRDTVSNAALSYQSVFGQENAATSGPVVPNPFQAYDDRPEPNDCLVRVGEYGPGRECAFGPGDGIPVVLFGDSHAEQWSETVRDIGNAHGWRIYQFTKAACPAQDLRPRPGRPDPFNAEDCVRWRDDVLHQIAALAPKIIIFSSLSTYVPDYGESARAWDDTLAALRATGARLVYIADTPYPNFQIADCMSGALDDWARCDFRLDDVTRHEPILTEQARGRDKDIITLSVNNLLCENDTCVPARNKILLYRDESHLTATAAHVLEPALTRQLDKRRFDYNAR
ncbi:acyltransferase [Gordonia polyisoprenivorans]|uniref:acyltransferase family protein n=1 Tax=Gordonia polyisoprenivorans TaxID=84595 RepID=UPI0022344772|nr:acyltransferase [Gordonia polyisoprenivorans]